MEFTFTRTSPTGSKPHTYAVVYEGETLCHIKGPPGKWNITDANTTHTHPTREAAAKAYLEAFVWRPEFEAIEEELKGVEWSNPRRENIRMDVTSAMQVYDILVREAGASIHDREAFVHSHTMVDACREWRFQGSLGFGGKFRNEARRWRIDCYIHDETPERRLAIARVNVQLQELYIERYGTPSEGEE